MKRWHNATHAVTPTPCPRPTRREIQLTGRLLATQSARGNRDADRLTAELHRAGLDLRDDTGHGSWPFLWLAVAALLVSAAFVVLVLLFSPGGLR